MGKLIKFYIPNNFKKKSRWIHEKTKVLKFKPKQLGRIIQIRSSASTVKYTYNGVPKY